VAEPLPPVEDASPWKIEEFIPFDPMSLLQQAEEAETKPSRPIVKAEDEIRVIEVCEDFDVPIIDDFRPGTPDPVPTIVEMPLEVVCNYFNEWRIIVFLIIRVRWKSKKNRRSRQHQLLSPRQPKN
jgi:hypothetical protein